MKVNKFLTAQWRNLRRGKGGRYRSKRFRYSVKTQLAVPDDQFYKIMNGQLEIDENDHQIIKDLVNNIKQIRK